MFRMADDFRPYMYEVLVSPEVTPKGAVLCVAGGFQGRTVVNEGYGIALEFRKLGYQCFVIHNRVNALDFNTKCSLNGKENGADIARAIRYIRANADQYRIPADRVAAAGFSNGGATIENCVQYYSGTRTVKEYFPGYEPDELDAYYGAPDVYINVYGQRSPKFRLTGQVLSIRLSLKRQAGMTIPAQPVICTHCCRIFWRTMCRSKCIPLPVRRTAELRIT